MKNNFILFNQLTTSVYQLEIQSTTYTKRLINTILKWQWLYLLIINALIIKKTDDGSIFNISLIPFVFMLLIYLYFVIIGINETKPFLVKLKVDLYKRTFEINYLQYNTPITEVINLDNLKIRRISNGIGYNIFRGSWKMEFLLEKKRIFTQYSIDEQWSPEKFKQLASEIKLLKEMKCT